MVSLAQYDCYTPEYYEQRESSPTFRAEQNALLRWLSVRQGDTVLEMGCGNGSLLTRLEGTGATVVGLDVSRSALEVARSRLKRAAVALGDATNLPFAAETFSGVAAQHLIEHFSPDAEVLREWYRVLRVGGRLVVATPNAGFPYPDWFDDPTHQIVYDRHTLRRELERVGFGVERIQYVNPYVGLPRGIFFAARHLQICTRIPNLGRRSLTLLAVATRPS